MEAVYRVAGIALVWGGGALAGLWLVRLVLTVVVGLWGRFTYTKYGNLWFVVKDWAHYALTGRARWQKQLTVADTLDMLAGWNSRTSHMRRFRRIATYRRALLAWMVRRQRAANLLTA